MLSDRHAENLKAVFAIDEKWVVLATDIGEVTDPAAFFITLACRDRGRRPPGSWPTRSVYAAERDPPNLQLLVVDRAETLPRPPGRRRASGVAVLRMIGTRTCLQHTSPSI